LLAVIRSSLFSIGYFLLTISYGTLSVALWLLPRRVRHKIISSWTTVVVAWLKLCCGVRYQVKGLENAASMQQAFVVLSKHQSAWETLFLQSLFWPSSTVLKQELLKIPFFGWGLRALYPIAIDRSNPRGALKQVKTLGIKHLSEGFNIILFPEGTRIAPGTKGVYARSGADIAAAANASIVPVALNAGHCWPINRFVKHSGLITVSIGPAIYCNGRTSKQVMAEVETWIENEMGALPSPTNRS
jgi:1-acyl-sn-glycerol-3-phosphate acyltransferase